MTHSGNDTKTRHRLLRITQVLAVLVLLWVMAPRIQAAMRPKNPPTTAMRTAADAFDPFQATEEPPAPPESADTLREELLIAAYSLQGTRYKWGAKGPDEYDCSGFTKAAYAAIDVDLPDGSFNQASDELPLESLEQLVPGDLLFYRWRGENGVSHVTMYVGDGWAIGAGSPGQPKEVVVYPLAEDLRIENTVITYRHIDLADEE